MSETRVGDDAPLLEISNLSKSFPGCVALAGVRLEVRPGEVLALVGQNGCGKSTLIKILSGFHQPDSGYEARFGGHPIHLGDSNAAHGLGIHFVHQDLGLLSDLSAQENLAVGPGFSTSRFGLVDWRAQRRRTRAALAALGYDFDVTVPVEELTPSQRVGVAIARAMLQHQHASLRLLVLDEPTASLPQAEVDILFAAVRRLASNGTAVLFVSHRLDEVFDVADRVTVMRDGRVVESRPVGEFDHATLITTILGRSVAVDHRDQTLKSVVTTAEPLLRVRGLCGKRLIDFQLEAQPGEIIGITGLTGSGREEVAPLLFGARRASRGTIEAGGRVVAHLTPTQAKMMGMALVPAARRQSAVFPDATVRENLSVADLTTVTSHLLIQRRRERSDSRRWMERLAVKPMRPEEALINLSGGNQQKVILARWLRRSPRILVLDEPTQGVDVGTKPEIYALLRDVASQGAAIIVCSTDSEEIVEVSTRALVLSAGRIHSELFGSTLTIDRLNHEIMAA